MNGGYIMVDFEGFNVNTGADEIPGISNRISKAMKTGKPIFANGLTCEGIGGGSTPIAPASCSVSKGVDGIYRVSIPGFGTGNTIHLTVAPNDAVTPSIT